jgi:uncharacterized protein YqhQ
VTLGPAGMLRYVKYLVFTATSWALTTADDRRVESDPVPGEEDILVGGQAVIEGVMMRSPKGHGVAVRRTDGSVAKLCSPLPTVGSRWRAFRLPFLRGVGILGQALVLGSRALKFSAEEALDEEAARGAQEGAKGAKQDQQTRAEGKGQGLFIAGNLILAVGINLVLFIGIPLVLTRLLESWLGFDNFLLFNAIDGVIRVAVFLAFISSMSLMEDMRRVFAYHGAEHKTVYAFEAKEELTAQNAQRHSTLHPRCGTSFLLIVMMVSILVFSVFHFESFLAKLISRVILMPMIAGIAYEIIRYSARRPGALARGIMAPGLMLQKITTNQPDDDQVEVAIMALEDALAVEETGRT